MRLSGASLEVAGWVGPLELHLEACDPGCCVGFDRDGDFRGSGQLENTRAPEA